ncbi:carbonic anhydrase family protein [Streptosporangium sp. NPDC023615]|uniref:carbonic anhydrase family protein n=1 Tax=Streptosporangium sp. NPDC023615 TaxID=3154794 RepID=UPI00342ACEB2
MAAAFLLPFITLPAPVQARAERPCHGTGTDAAVQSPITIDRSAACPGAQAPLEVHYPSSVDGTLLFQDRAPVGEAGEHDDVRFVIGTGGAQPYITYGGRRYNLINVHFHGHAEHRFAGQPFAPLEAHLVHEKATGTKGYVVFSVLVDSKDFHGLSEHDHLIASPPALGASRPLRGVHLRDLLPANHTTYRYTGSLTTPDESDVYFQPVTWVVFGQHARARQHDVQAYRSLWGAESNHREIQDNHPAPNIYSYH